jgi:murein DD-endopeptidase MepM/ murein hydrolase activator NlpD
MIRGMPSGLKILLIPHDQTKTREYNISRRLIFVFILMGLLLAAMLIGMVLTYGSLMEQAQRVQGLQRDLVDARGRLVQVQELNLELQRMREIQERVVNMLGARSGTTAGAAMDNAAAGLYDAVMSPPPDQWPLRGYVTKEFAEGDIPNAVRPHTGIDLVAAADTRIMTAGAGVVQLADWDDFLGNFVEIRHGFGYVTVYGHCAELLVHSGQRVAAGQAVAVIGGSGQATSPHLHFEVWRDGVAVDPRTVISGDPEKPVDTAP